MFMKFRRAGIIASLAIGAVTMGAASAEARDRYYQRDRGNDAALAIGAGVVGLALGAAIASSNSRDRYYRDDYYRAPPRYYRGYPRGYYYDRQPRRYYNQRNYRHDRRWNGNRDRRRFGGW